MPEYPSGIVAFLFTDIEGSTKRWERDAAAMWSLVERHFALLEEAITAHDGVLFKTIGDAVQAAFPAVPAAVEAAVEAQSALRREDWGDLGPLRVRMAIHVGEAVPRAGDYLAPCLNRLARILASGYGDQILLSEAAHAAIGMAILPGYDLLDLGSHRLRDLLQPEHIYQLRGPDLVAEFPPLKSLDRHLHNLPAQPTTLIGRETEVAAIRAMFEQEGARVVTLTGPGGTGKTRLGLQIGAELVERFADGVWFVPLASITDPDLVIPAIARPLGVREVAGEPLLTTLQEHLRHKHALLLLDNFEHLIAAAPAVAAILSACPNVQALVTSRQPLRIAGEREFSVPPLALPTEHQARTLSSVALLEYPAIRLFVERAQAVKPDFDLSPGTAPDITAICRRLDGLPLAIELAAARVRVLSPSALLARLDNRLKVLTGGQRDLPARQQTLRATIEWSHDLLDPDEQELFARLAVFSGGCTLEAAEAVCGGADGLTIDLLDSLDSLTQKSLLRVQDETDGSPRFTMLETIREFGLERLEALGDAENLRGAHAHFYLALAEEAEPELTGPDQIGWLARLDSDHDNLRAALGWLERTGDRELRLRLAAALWRFWWLRGYLTEGRGWLDRAVTNGTEFPPDIRARALRGAGILAESQGDYERATNLHEEALAVARQLGNQEEIAKSLTDLGIIARAQSEYARAANLQEQALSLWRELNHEAGVASSLSELGRVAIERGDYAAATELLEESVTLGRATGDLSMLIPMFESLGELAFYQEDYDQAETWYQQCLAASRELGDPRMIAHSLAALGEAIHHQGDLRRAEPLYQEALARYRDLGEQRGESFALCQLGKVALARADLATARSFLFESLELRRDGGDKWAIIESLESLAGLASIESNPTLATVLLGAADAQRTAFEAPLPPSYAGEQRRSLAAARESLGDADFSTAWRHGQALTLEQAVAEALTAARPGMDTRRWQPASVAAPGARDTLVGNLDD